MLARFAPTFAQRRIEARYRAARIAGALLRYDAAGHGARVDSWITPASSANRIIESTLPTLRARSRDLTRNNAWAAKAVRAWQVGVVGLGIKPKPVSFLRMLPDFDESAADREEAEAKAAWHEWAESTECDADGKHTIYGLQSIAQRETTEAGEVLVRLRRRRVSDGLSVPIQLDLLEADHLDTTKAEIARDRTSRVVQGVEHDALGRITAYWLYRDHPGDAYPFSGRLDSVRVPAESVIHLFRCDRKKQARGIPWGASAMLPCRDWNEISEAELVRLKIAACHVGFIHDLTPDQEEFPGQVTDVGQVDSLDPGLVEMLPPGRDVKFNTPPTMEDYPDYSRVTLRQIATGYGVPYEILTGDLANVNFHSGRLGRLDWGADLSHWRAHEFVPSFCDRAWRWFQDAAVAAGVLRAPTAVIWRAQPLPLIEPGRETRAVRDQVRAGFKSLSEAIEERGADPEEVLAQLSRDRELLRGLGVSVDSITPDPEPPSDNGTEDRATPGDGPDAQLMAELLEDFLELHNRSRSNGSAAPTG